MKLKFIIAAGGTGGHITPGIAIASALKQDGHEVIFVGTEDRMEKDLIPKAGFEIRFIHASGLKKDLIGKVKAIIDMNKGIADCTRIIEEYKPDMCIGTGGYLTAPLMLAAKKMKIPTLIHESNALPGKTTKLMSSKVDAVCVGFQEAKEKLKKGNVIVTGNPNKMCLNNLSKKEAKEKIDIDGKLLLIFGGSLGAKKLNETIRLIINNKSFGEYSVIYATGKNNYEEIVEKVLAENQEQYEIVKKEEEIILYPKTEVDSKSLTFVSNQNGREKEVKTANLVFSSHRNPIIIKSFIYNMEEVMKAADLVLCRSGALTCTEIAEVGVASILIPFPYAAENHQLYNAETLKNVDAAIIIEEHQLVYSLLSDAINDIMNDDELCLKMAENSKKLRMGNPIENIKNEIYKILS